jgi:aminodeoxychorismate synthase component I
MRDSVPSHLLEELPLERPFHTYFELFRARSCPFLLDSASDPETLGQYSFMGAEPSLVFRAKRTVPAAPGAPHRARVTLHRGAPDVSSNLIADHEGDPFEELRKVLAAYALPGDGYQARPTPLLAGAVGYLGYEAGYFVESLPDTGRDDLALPDLHFGFYDALIAHCHRTGRSYVSSLGRGPDEGVARARARRARDALVERLRTFEAAGDTPWVPPAAGARELVADHVDERRYAALVERMKEHILAGDLYEGCLTHRIESPFAGDPWDLYRELRRVNPSPFACYLGLPEATIVSSSPERFLRLGADGVAESRPIKGTRRRGANAEEDRALAVELASSVKDQAENTMIVDLVRNDLGRVCRFGSVHVPELRIVERYATLLQLVSTVRGELDAGRDAIDLLRACFPGGSMTGAPKIAAMKLIDALEPVKRGVYAGSVGYLDFAGPLDLNIVIRTFTLAAGRALYGVGGAVVADSEAASEYTETLDKARALFAALRSVSAP